HGIAGHAPGRHHGRLRAPLPPLDGAAPQGRTEPGELRPDRRRLVRRRSPDRRPPLHLPAAVRGPGPRRPDDAAPAGPPGVAHPALPIGGARHLMATPTSTVAAGILEPDPLVDRTDVRPVPPCALVVFGASGDLFARKLLPGLARLAAEQVLPGRFAVVGVARTAWSDDDFRRFALDAVAAGGHGGPDRTEGARWREIVSGFRYVTGDYDHDETYEQLATVLDEGDHVQGTAGNRLYYLAVPPTAFPTVLAGIGRHHLQDPLDDAPDAFTRIVIEKPYGTDLHSAEELDRCVHAVFDERQVFRIDHYLGKETVQNFLALRFANAVFEPVWNRRYVDSVQITVAESAGVGHRAAFYEQTGALRDMVQNH